MTSTVTVLVTGWTWIQMAMASLIKQKVVLTLMVIHKATGWILILMATVFWIVLKVRLTPMVMEFQTT